MITLVDRVSPRADIALERYKLSLRGSAISMIS